LPIASGCSAAPASSAPGDPPATLHHAKAGARPLQPRQRQGLPWRGFCIGNAGHPELIDRIVALWRPSAPAQGESPALAGRIDSPPVAGEHEAVNWLRIEPSTFGEFFEKRSGMHRRRAWGRFRRRAAVAAAGLGRPACHRRDFVRFPSTRCHPAGGGSRSGNNALNAETARERR
jgi:hypothetical protein